MLLKSGHFSLKPPIPKDSLSINWSSIEGQHALFLDNFPLTLSIESFILLSCFEDKLGLELCLLTVSHFCFEYLMLLMCSTLQIS